MYMLDTNICIYIIKNRPEQVRERLAGLAPGDVCISSVTLAELATGVEKSRDVERNRTALHLFLAPLKVLAFDDHAALAYGKIRAELAKRGTPIGSMDMLIAAHAVSSRCVLVTNNEREFKRVQGLTIENWVNGRR